LKSLSKYYFKRSIRTKLLLYFLTLILLPIITLGIIGNIIYSDNIEELATTHTSEMINQVNKSIEFYIQEMDKIINTMSNEPSVVQFLQLTSNEDLNRIDVETELRRILASVSDSYEEIAGVLIANDYDLYVSNELYKMTRDPIMNEDWYKICHLNPDLIQLISKPIGRGISTSLSYTTEDVVSVAKAIKDPETGEAMGTLLIDLKLGTIEKIIDGITLGKSGFIFLTDSLGNVIYAPVNPVVYRVNEEWMRKLPNGSFIKKIGDSRYQIIYSTSNYTKWRTIGVFSLNAALKEVENQRYFTLVIGGITLALAILIGFVFTASIVNPLNKLKRLMAEAEKGNLDINFDSDTHDEISDLGNSFNKMIEKIKELIDLVYAEQKSKREAELKILQAQIKPHFLYNTLDTIQWMVNDNKPEEASNVINALTTLFRIGLSRGRELITLEQEMEHVRSYLYIQKTRYEDKLEMSIGYDEQLNKYSITKLILQPLVENAIYHGIKQKRGKGHISVSVRKRSNKLCFIIEDDGAGIPETKLKKLNETLSGKKPRIGSIGYGLFNVNERIRLSFGEEYGIRIKSIVGKGTTVIVWHPIILEEENKDV
jgi:two-component system sensor histidine kinase YesM